MRQMQEIAYAKINLALHVRAREPDGYHRIETVFAFCEHGDVLSAGEAGALSLEVTGPFAEALAGERDNLVLQAARSLDRKVAFTLEKNLPVAAGLGGGSADAAAALRILGGGLEVATVLGADVPACLLSRTARGAGRGDEIEPVDIPGLSGTPVLLVNPGVKLSTAAVFKAWDGVDRGPLGRWEEGRNDLQAAAVGLVPEIADALDALSGARIARMSGSGATCFGLYEGEAERDADAARIAAARPGWWVSQTRLR
jgi:4-diphosphocytidyl-2-C-methyl-D-erythritol kinase